MPMFQKKPLIVEARRLIVGAYFGDWPDVDLGAQGNYAMVKTLEGPMWADYGDWIIKGVAGEFYPCKPNIFEATYSAVAA